MKNHMQQIKVIVGKIGLDGHDRGIKIISRSLRNAGMDVIYLGMRLTPDVIARTVQDEGADVVGISVLSGAHMRLIPKLITSLNENDVLNDTLLIVGGTIPDKDIQPLLNMGVDGVFPVGSFTDSLIQFIEKKVPKGSNQTSATPGSL